jgi:hypothetical protein
VRDQVPENPWIRFYNGYFEVRCFDKNNSGLSVIGDMFISYDR